LRNGKARRRREGKGAAWGPRWQGWTPLLARQRHGPIPPTPTPTPPPRAAAIAGDAFLHRARRRHLHAHHQVPVKGCQRGARDGGTQEGRRVPGAEPAAGASGGETRGLEGGAGGERGASASHARCRHALLCPTRPPGHPSSHPRAHSPTRPPPARPPPDCAPRRQTSVYSSALFLTSGAQNLLCINLAAKMGVIVPDVWMSWFIGCLPQAIIGMVLVPLLLFKQYPPEVRGLGVPWGASDWGPQQRSRRWRRRGRWPGMGLRCARCWQRAREQPPRARTARTRTNPHPSSSPPPHTHTTQPQVKETPEAPNQARERLAKMGPMSRNEIITTATICGAVVLWIMGDAWGVPAVLAAMLGLSALLLTGAGARARAALSWNWAAGDGACCAPFLQGLQHSRLACASPSPSPLRRDELARLPRVPACLGLPHLVRAPCRGGGAPWDGAHLPAGATFWQRPMLAPARLFARAHSPCPLPNRPTPKPPGLPSLSACRPRSTTPASSPPLPT
jgi:hypothetical protein